MSEVPKGIDPKVWELAYGFAFNWEENETLIEQMAEELHEIISQAIEAERDDLADLVEQMLRFADTTSNADRVISQAIRNRSNTTTERNE